MKNLVLIPDHQLAESDLERGMLDAGLGLRVGLDTVENLGDVIGLMSWHTARLNADYLSQFENLRAIVRIGAGFDNVDLSYSRENNIVVSNVPDYGVEDVADHTMALFLAVERGLAGPDSLPGHATWSWGPYTKHRRLTDLCFAVVGLGRIGTAVARRAQAFCREVGFFDPYAPIGIEKSLRLRRFESLNKLAEWSDVVSFHCNLTSETAGMIGYNFFEHLKKGATLINTARGGLFVGDAVRLAVENEIVKRLGLDVLPDESMPFEDPVYLMSEKTVNGATVIVTPHCAFTNSSSLLEIRTKACEEMNRILIHNKPKYQVRGA